jgi:hypothetical protein
MKADFEVTYSSGRIETLVANGPKAIKEMREDLKRAQQLGGVTNFKEKTFASEDQRKNARKMQAAVFLKPEVLKAIQEQAIESGKSVSSVIAARVGA